MAQFRLRLTPTLRPFTAEGGLDTSINNSGYSIQRTGYVDVYNSTNRKIVEVADGEVFTDTMVTWASDGTIVSL